MQNSASNILIDSTSAATFGLTNNHINKPLIHRNSFTERVVSHHGDPSKFRLIFEKNNGTTRKTIPISDNNMTSESGKKMGTSAVSIISSLSSKLQSLRDSFDPRDAKTQGTENTDNHSRGGVLPKTPAALFLGQKGNEKEKALMIVNDDNQFHKLKEDLRSHGMMTHAGTRIVLNSVVESRWAGSLAVSKKLAVGVVEKVTFAPKAA